MSGFHIYMKGVLKLKHYYIYMTTNNITGMKYIGKHYGELDDSYLGSGKKLKLDIDIYGKNSFTKSILFISNSEEENCKKEIEFIVAYNAIEDPMFYNIHQGGAGGNTMAGYSEEEKQEYRNKMSVLMSGCGNGMYGKCHTEETKEKLSDWATHARDNSVYRSEEFRNKMSALTSGPKNGMYGKKHSDASKQQMSINSIGKTAGEKNGMYGKSGDKAINGKQIAMYNENNELVKTFNAKTAVLQFLSLKGHTQLDRAIKEQTLYKGYYWKQINKD